MMVMPSNNASMIVGYLAGRFPGRIGWLMSPDSWKPPHDWLSYAFDNGKFTVWSKGKQWHEGPFYAHCERVIGRRHKPLWIAVPDVVASREGTLRSWFEHAPRVSRYGVPLAFVVQDGMTPEDVPSSAEVVFVGGTDEWKMRNLKMWTTNFPRVHVGRINGEKGLWECHHAGAESCDGTGWFRGDQDQLAGLVRYLEHSSGSGHPQMQML
jgi:hypothetical protein